MTLKTGGKERKHTAKGDPSLHRHPGYHQVENIAADIVKVHIGKASSDHLLPEIRSPVIDRNIDANLSLEPFDFIFRTGDSDNFKAHDFSNLASDGTNGTGGTRDEESLSSLDLANVDQALNAPIGISA